MRRNWTDAERTALKFLTLRDAMGRFGRSRSSVLNARLRFGLALSERACVNDGEVRRLHALGWPDGQIGFELSLHRGTVQNIRQRLGLAANVGTEATRVYLAARRRQAARRVGCERYGMIRVVNEQLIAARQGWPAGAGKRAAEIMAVMERLGPCRTADLRDALGVSLWRVWRWLKRLRGEGWAVCAGPTQRRRLWSLAPAVLAGRQRRAG